MPRSHLSVSTRNGRSWFTPGWCPRPRADASWPAWWRRGELHGLDFDRSPRQARVSTRDHSQPASAARPFAVGMPSHSLCSFSANLYACWYWGSFPHRESRRRSNRPGECRRHSASNRSHCTSPNPGGHPAGQHRSTAGTCWAGHAGDRQFSLLVAVSCRILQEEPPEL